MNIGSVVVDWFTPLVSDDSSPFGKGQRSVTITGAGTHLVVDELREIVENYRNRETVGEETGIKQYIDFDCDSLASRNGWYLLQGFSDSIDKLHMDAIASTDIDLGHGPTAVIGFSITAVLVGLDASRLDVVLHTVDAVGVTSRTAVGIPPSDLDPAGQMRVAVGGVVIYRDYDPEMDQP